MCAFRRKESPLGMLNVRREGSRKSEAGSSPRLKKMKSSKKCLMLIGMKAVVPSGKAPSSELHSKGLKGSFGSEAVTETTTNRKLMWKEGAEFQPTTQQNLAASATWFWLYSQGDKKDAPAAKESS